MLQNSLFFIKVLIWLLPCGHNKNLAIKAKANSKALHESSALGAPCRTARSCSVQSLALAQHSHAAAAHSLTNPSAELHQDISACFHSVPSLAGSTAQSRPVPKTHFLKCRDVPIPSYTDPLFPSPTCPSPLLPSVAHPAKTAVKYTAHT